MHDVYTQFIVVHYEVGVHISQFQVELLEVSLCKKKWTWCLFCEGAQTGNTCTRENWNASRNDWL